LKPTAGAFTGIAPHDPVVGEGNLLTRVRIAHQPADLMQAVEEETVRYLESARESSDEYLASIRLHPPELGGVAMKLRVRDQEIELRLGVESEDIRCLIETNLSTLRTALNDRGYSLTQCDVFVSGDRHGGTDPNVPWSGGEHVQVRQESAVIHSKGQARVSTLTENRVNVLV
jgi:hypothetical protein